MQASKQKVQNQEKINVNLTFLSETREGKFANVDKDSLRYSRQGNRTPDIYEDCEEHFYGIS